MTTQSDIERLAKAVAKEALKPDTDLPSRLEALKILAPIYVVLMKRKGAEDAETDEPSMGDIQSRLRVVEEADDGRTEGGRAVPTRKRRGA
jgi:hypothetical protein